MIKLLFQLLGLSILSIIILLVAVYSIQAVWNHIVSPADALSSMQVAGTLVISLVAVITANELWKGRKQK